MNNYLNVLLTVTSAFVPILIVQLKNNHMLKKVNLKLNMRIDAIENNMKSIVQKTQTLIAAMDESAKNDEANNNLYKHSLTYLQRSLLVKYYDEQIKIGYVNEKAWRSWCEYVELYKKLGGNGEIKNMNQTLEKMFNLFIKAKAKKGVKHE